MNNIAVVTLNWNANTETLQLIKDLKKQKKVNCEIIVVDNGSKDYLSLVNELKTFNDIKIIRNNENLGFAKGVNQGIELALNEKKYSYIMIINNDTRIYDELFLFKYAKRINSEKAKKIFVPLIVYENTEIIWFAIGKLNKKLLAPIHRFKGYSVKDLELKIDKEKIKEFSAGDFISGCCIMFTPEMLEQIGFFDENFFAYYEDLDFSIRGKKLGYSFFTLGDLILHHKRSASTTKNSKKFSRFQIYLWARNSIILSRKHNFSMVKLFLFRPLIYAYWFIKADSKNKYFRDLYTGIRDGFSYNLNLPK